MSDTKCPVCKTGNVQQGRSDTDYFCDNEFCPSYNETDSSTYGILIRTRKALDVAVDTLKYANKCIKGGCVNWETEIDRALEQITALEQIKNIKGE